MLLDWRNPESFHEINVDIVLASDIAYDPVALPSLLSSLEVLFTTQGVQSMIISTPKRNEETFNFFIDEIRGRGYQINGLIHPQTIYHIGGRDEIALWKLTKMT